MNDWMDGSDWLWMTLSMTVGIVVLGAVIYAAVARQPRFRAATLEMFSGSRRAANAQYRG